MTHAGPDVEAGTAPAGEAAVAAGSLITGDGGTVSGASLRWQLGLLLAALATVAVAVGLLTWRAIAVHDAADERARDTLLPARGRVDELQNALVDQQTGVRGYTLTGDERFLEPYDSGLERAGAAIEHLRADFRDDAELIGIIDVLTDRAAVWRAATAEPEIALRRAGATPGIEAALEGKASFDEVRASVRALRGAIGTRFDAAQHEADAANTRQRVTRLIFAGVMIASILALALALFRLISRPLDELRRHVRRAAEDIYHPVPASGPAELIELATDVEAMRIRLRDAVTKGTAVLAAIGDAYAFSDTTVIVEVNDRLVELTGFERDELVGAATPYPFWPTEEMGDLGDTADGLRATSGADLETTFVTKAGARVPVSVTIRPATTPSGEQIGWVTTMRDISKFKRREHDLYDIASRDALTGLFNRRAIDDRLAALESGDALVVIDLDHFKRVNDTLGHAAGDEVLRQLGQMLGGRLRDGDWAGRLGGEEFVLVLGGVYYNARHIAERLRAQWLATDPHATFSAGIAIHHSSHEPRQTLARADEALYVAKHSGRNRVETWTLPPVPAEQATHPS